MEDHDLVLGQGIVGEFDEAYIITVVSFGHTHSTFESTISLVIVAQGPSHPDVAVVQDRLDDHVHLNDHVQNLAPKKKKLRNQDQDPNQKKLNLVPSLLMEKAKNQTVRVSMSLVTRVRRRMVVRRKMAMKKMGSRLEIESDWPIR